MGGIQNGLLFTLKRSIVQIAITKERRRYKELAVSLIIFLALFFVSFLFWPLFIGGSFKGCVKASQAAYPLG